jgi:hypothetical protein
VRPLLAVCMCVAAAIPVAVHMHVACRAPEGDTAASACVEDTLLCHGIGLRNAARYPSAGHAEDDTLLRMTADAMWS